MAIKFRTKNVEVSYGDKKAIRDISLNIKKNTITALIGPSGCGKSTFLRCLNRMNDVIENCSIKGSVLLDEQDIYGPDIDPVELRARVGMVFQKANPFPKSIFDNIAYGPRIHGLASSDNELKDIVHNSLEKAGLIDEVKDRLNDQATGLSGGQQQRIALARALAPNPQLLLMDEPFSALDPITRDSLQQEFRDLQARLGFSAVMVTHDMAEALIMADQIAVMQDGAIFQQGTPVDLLESPASAYVTGLLETPRRQMRAIRELGA